MEYYDLPPIKFGLSNGNKVLNIITKKRGRRNIRRSKSDTYVTSASLEIICTCGIIGAGISGRSQPK